MPRVTGLILGMLLAFILGGSVFLIKSLDDRLAKTPTSPLQWIDFELPTSDGSIWSPTAVENRVVILNFWAPWCLPCRTEIPHLIEIQMRNNPALIIIGIAIDEREAVRRFEDEVGLNYLSLIGETQGIELMQRYGASATLPLTLVFDQVGELRHRFLGSIRPAELENALEQLL
jgi:thiol-disulfide isomerase/thioredoxin